MRSSPTVRLAIALVTACSALATSADADWKNVQLQVASGELAEDELLDVGVQVFDPGLRGDPEQLKEDGVFPDVRKSEARYFAHRLKATLQGSGHWGAVRIVPLRTQALDVTVAARIERSNGKWLELYVRVVDSRGKEWLSKTYKGEANPRAYADEGTHLDDPHQGVYNEIANDIYKKRRGIRPLEVAQVRQVTALAFAADLAPSAFEGYLRRDRKGRLEVVQLPAEGDTMFARVSRIRERDGMLVDTLDEHYATFAGQIDTSYQNWRSYSYEETIAYEALQSSARKRKILGGIAILGGILIGGGDSRGERSARDAAILGGIAAIQSGMQKADEAKIHRAAIEELAQSFDAEMQPVLIEVENQTLRLSGSAETQYAEWRELMRGIFATETGFPTDPNVAPGAATPTPPSDVVSSTELVGPVWTSSTQTAEPTLASQPDDVEQR